MNRKKDYCYNSLFYYLLFLKSIRKEDKKRQEDSDSLYSSVNLLGNRTRNTFKHDSLSKSLSLVVNTLYPLVHS